MPTATVSRGCIVEDVVKAKDGKRFEGTHRADKRDGKFVEKDRDGQITAKGYYENGKRFED